MSVSDTESRIITVICDHFLSASSEKLTIKLVAKCVGISRQAFHKNYLHLKPFITGRRPIDELLLRQEADAYKVVLRLQKLVRNLEAELVQSRSTEEARFSDFESGVITSLMQSDILTHRAKELTAELKKKALHVELLKRKVTEMELEQALNLQAPGAAPTSAWSKESLVQVFKPNLSEATARFSDNADVDEYLMLKERALQAMQQKILKVLRHGVVRVVVFQERYLCSFDKFVERYFSDCSASMLVVNLPLYASVEVREFLRALKGANPIDMYVPYCESEAVIKAQRGFMFQHVPEFELRAVSREPLPTIFDGYDKVTAFRIVQGE